MAALTAGVALTVFVGLNWLNNQPMLTSVPAPAHVQAEALPAHVEVLPAQMQAVPLQQPRSVAQPSSPARRVAFAPEPSERWAFMPGVSERPLAAAAAGITTASATMAAILPQTTQSVVSPVQTAADPQLRSSFVGLGEDAITLPSAESVVTTWGAVAGYWDVLVQSLAGNDLVTRLATPLTGDVRGVTPTATVRPAQVASPVVSAPVADPVVAPAAAVHPVRVVSPKPVQTAVLPSPVP